MEDDTIMGDAIVLNHVQKKYDQKIVINDVSLKIAKGDFVSIIGESGAGKSTLLNIMGLMDCATRGAVIIHNKKNPFFNSKEAMMLRRNSIGYLFQNYALIDDESVYYNLQLGLKFKKNSKAENKRIISETLEKLGIENLLQSKIYQLSGGEQQRVAVARLLLQNNDIILADEPTGSLDPKNKQIVINYLQRFNEEGKTVVIVTHDEDIAKSCKKTINISDIEHQMH